MMTSMNIRLMTYFTFVSIIGTLGNGVILLAYGNRWNSSKSTSVIFILILACVDLWTCLIVVPAIAIMEYRDFDAPTLICRFYSFSKNLIIISSFIMSFIALDRLLNIALPHSRLLNPRRVKVLLTLFISIGIGLGTLTALAFSTQPFRNHYLAEYNLVLANESFERTNNYMEIVLDADLNSSLIPDTINLITAQIPAPDDANIIIVRLAHLATSDRCFADTSIISETLRTILKHLSNKLFYASIGIVTIFYTITFVLALRRQNPRIRALKKSLNVLNKFDSYTPAKPHQQATDSVVVIQRPLSSSVTTYSVSPKLTTTDVSIAMNRSHEDLLSKQMLIKADEQQYEMSKFLNHDDSDDQNLPSPATVRKSTKNRRKSQAQEEQQVSSSEGTSDELQAATEKINSTKQVSFRIENRRNTLNHEQNKHASISTVALNGDLVGNKDMYYKLPCPCLTTRQLLVKVHFARPSSKISQWLCCYCIKKQPPIQHHSSLTSQPDDESVTPLPSTTTPYNHSSASQSETLRRQLHQHRLRQIRMVSTFLIITVSFVLFYLPSVLNADMIIRSPLMIYYLFLCTHALNPVIYCFMNPSLRAYVLSMFHCRRKRKQRKANTRSSFLER